MLAKGSSEAAITRDAAELRSALAKVLAVAEDFVPWSAVQKASLDPLFLHHLFISRGDEFLLSMLFAEASSSNSGKNSQPSLARSAVSATLKWIAAGLPFVTDEVFRRRINACENCPNRKQAPRKAVYSMLGTKFVCGLCGCDIEKKARLATEVCPDSTFNNSTGRW